MDTAIVSTATELVKSKPFAGLQLQLMKHSPEILVGAGIAGVVVSTVLACRATLSAQEKVEAAKERYAYIREAVAYSELPEDNPLHIEYPDSERRQNLATATLQTGVDFVKLYGIPVALMGLSFFAILKGHGISMKRNEALAAAVTTMATGYNAYRGRVKEAYGEEAELDIFEARKTETVEEVTTGKDGKEKTTSKKVKVSTLEPGHSGYARFYDEASPNWQPSPELNLAYLIGTQNWANDKLRINRHLFLNEVYDMLGIPRSSEGAAVGWLLSDEGDGYVDFGIHTTETAQGRRFVNGEEVSMLLDFNVDGPIWDKI
jgi:hypothetical protein